MTIMVNRRERVRAATVQEIKEVARRQLVTDGPAAVSLRAIAREMGMTAPALYRYFPSFEHLVHSLVDDIYNEACDVVEKACNDAATPTARFEALTRAYRDWAVGHRAEYGLLAGSIMPGTPAPDPTKAGAAAQRNHHGAARLEILFLNTVTDMWEDTSYTTPAPDDLANGLVEQLSSYRDAIGSTLPLGALAVAVGCWTRFQGLVSMEVFNHLRFAWQDGKTHGTPFFEQQLKEMVATLTA